MHFDLHMSHRTDMLISKGKGVMKGVRARLDGVAGVFRTLTEQHGEVEALLQRVRRDAAKRRDLWPKIRAELLSHERAEIQEVYPALREHEPTRSLAEQHDVDASELEQLIGRLDAMDIASDAWGTMLDELTGVVVAHAREEETVIFPLAQSVLPDVLVKRLDERFLAAKRRIVESA
jgi:hemerythrin superfamily protein